MKNRHITSQHHDRRCLPHARASLRRPEIGTQKSKIKIKSTSRKMIRRQEKEQE